MPPFRRLLALSAPLFLLACVPPAPEIPTVPLPEADACGASALQNLVGQPFSALAAMTFAGPMRLIRPDMAVTMDYSPERLNIFMNSADIIDSVSCG